MIVVESHTNAQTPIQQMQELRELQPMFGNKHCDIHSQCACHLVNVRNTSNCPLVGP